MKNSDMPAMPVMDESEIHGQHYGLTKREHFAALAMQGVWPDLMDGCQPRHLKYSVKQCVMFADALLAELDKEIEADE